MKKFTSLKILFVGILLVLTSFVNAQVTESFALKNDATAVVNKELKLSISYGEKIKIGLENNKEANNYNWQILDSNLQLIASGNGLDLEKYIFNVPGNFTVNINDTHLSSSKSVDSCTHIAIPENLAVEVVPIKMMFLFDQMVFSSPLLGDTEIVGTLTIPVDIETYKNIEYTSKQTIFRSAGIQASLKIQ